MNIKILFALLIGFLLLPCSAWCAAADPEEVKLLYVIDGDTIKVEYAGKKVSVRLIGVDTPESRSNKKAREESQRSGSDLQEVLILGKKAAEYTQTLLEGKRSVFLEFDVQKYDRYQRLLAYVWFSRDPRDPENMLNYKIVKAGYGQSMTVPPNVKYKDLFLSAQQSARKANKGLWGSEASEQKTFK